MLWNFERVTVNASILKIWKWRCTILKLQAFNSGRKYFLKVTVLFTVWFKEAKFNRKDYTQWIQFLKHISFNKQACADARATLKKESVLTISEFRKKGRKDYDGRKDCLLLMLFSHCVQFFCDFMGCSLPGSSVHGILQARVLEWVPSLSPREDT